MKKSLAIILCLAMLLGVLAGCSGGANDKPLVAGYSNFSSKFSPFFSETAYDQDVWAMTSISLLDILWPRRPDHHPQRRRLGGL